MWELVGELGLEDCNFGIVAVAAGCYTDLEAQKGCCSAHRESRRSWNTLLLSEEGCLVQWESRRQMWLTLELHMCSWVGPGRVVANRGLSPGEEAVNKG